MYRVVAVSIALLLAGMTAAQSQQPLPGSPHQRAVCHPDVVKFCKTELAAKKDDVFAILSCLQRNRSRISRACREVLSNNGK